MAKQERKSTRTRTRVRARVTKVGADKPVTGFTRDVSNEGLFIQTRAPFPRGTALDIELHYPDKKIDLRGVVVRSENVPLQLQSTMKAGMGIRVRPSDGLNRLTGQSRDTRVPLGSDVVVFSGSERYLLKLHDVSVTGAALVSEDELPDLAFVRMHFKLSTSNEVVEVEGVPVNKRRLGDEHLIAINFLDPPTEFVARVEELIGERGGEEE